MSRRQIAAGYIRHHNGTTTEALATPDRVVIRITRAPAARDSSPAAGPAPSK